MKTPARTPAAPAVHVPEPLTYAPTVQPAPPAPVAQVVTPQGDVVTGYLMQAADHHSPAPAQPQPLPVWVRSAALLMPVTAGSVTLAFWGLSLAVESLAALAAALWHLFLCLLALSAVAAVAVTWRPRRGGATATATATATSRGPFGKATAQATATVKK
ncbi:hypothetical protein [Streptomyces chartreusis]|uniref:Uncharacterized protein n=1 Tax=Streptomyces chartreusis TaxID=1969 RepID=A0A7H8T9Y2_STRCX|nr:hypothetical protein [Streptomyces chartreusis]QKZ20286.1 hypothetical protein HUT05_24795 [Streptomyces chartreusis]